MRIARERYECPCRGGCPHPLSRAARGFAAASLLTFPLTLSFRPELSSPLADG
jgi:hypothetical protein